MDSKDCIFCKIASGEIGSAVIYSDDAVLSFLDVGPISHGHTLVICKEHYERLDQCPAEVLSQVIGVVAKVARAVVKGMDADGYNILCNTGRAAGQLVEHLHFHIIPRKKGDGLFDRWPAYKYEEGVLEEVAGKIRDNL